MIELLNSCQHKDSKDYNFYANIYDKSMNSCKYWWADPWRFSPDLIKSGIEDNFRIFENIGKLKQNNMVILKGKKLRVELENKIFNFYGY